MEGRHGSLNERSLRRSFYTRIDTGGKRTLSIVNDSKCFIIHAACRGFGLRVNRADNGFPSGSEIETVMVQKLLLEREDGYTLFNGRH